MSDHSSTTSQRAAGGTMTTTDWRKLCEELFTDYKQHLYRSVLADRVEVALAEPVADGPAVPESREPASVTGEPTDEELLELMPETMRDEFSYAAKACSNATGGQVKPGIFRVCLNRTALEYARAVLARFGHQPAPPAEGEVGEAALVRRMCEIILGNTFGNKELDSLALLVGHHPDVLNAPDPAPAGEVAELVDRLRRASDGASAMGWEQDSWVIARAADLLEQRHPTPVPGGMIPVEYWDIDSGARIVTEPSEEGPGGCWVVLNSRYVNPLDEFQTAQAAWDALQQATAMPLPSGEVE